MKIERRNTQGKVELRKHDGEQKIVGHAAVFNKLSENLGGFREIIAEGAFDNNLDDDVRALFNHDSNHVLGRNGTTLKLSVDDIGLRYEIDTPDTQTGRDLVVLMERGDIDQSSFGFTVDEDEWEEDDDGRVIRTITKIKRLFDVSPVTYAAYPDTSVALRGLEQFNGKQKGDQEIQTEVTELAERVEQLTQENSRLLKANEILKGITPI